MKRQRKNELGITLIALVISIIVMLILAGVSLNATIGENGIVTRAQEAKTAQENAQIQEELEYMIAHYNIDANNRTIDEYLQAQKNDGKLDKFTMIPDPTDTSKRVRMIQKGNNFYYVLEDGDFYRLEKMNTDMSGEIGEGYTIVTANNFTGGTMDFNPGEGNSATLIFNDKINAEYNFNITSGEVTIYIDNDMTLTNANVIDELTGLGRSAINIYPNAVLNLHISDGKILKVDSGYGKDGEIGNENGAKGGPGGFAGIHVPIGATLRLYGEGTVKAYGGKAGNGVDSSKSYGGAGGGGGNHYDGGGGFSGAGSQHNAPPGYNGLGGGSGKGTNKGSCCGGGYYSSGVGRTPFWEMGLVGGMGGGHCYGAYGLDYVGCGGKAGSGGNITYSDANNIFAYNGDMITNGDYTSDHYQYNKDGLYLYKIVSGNKVYKDYIWDETSEKYYYFNNDEEKVFEEGEIQGDTFSVITKKDVKENVINFIPTFIFAQSGTVRKTYTTNMSQFTYSKITRTLGNGETLPNLATDYDSVVTVLATNEINNEQTGYSNGYMPNQGIGSGAGYLESSNGSFEPIN